MIALTMEALLKIKFSTVPTIRKFWLLEIGELQ